MRSTSTLLSSSCFFYPCNSSTSSSSSSLSLSSGPAPFYSSFCYLQSLLLLLVASLDSRTRCLLVLEHVHALGDELVKAVDGGDSADVLEGEEQR